MSNDLEEIQTTTTITIAISIIIIIIVTTIRPHIAQIKRTIHLVIIDSIEEEIRISIIVAEIIVVVFGKQEMLEIEDQIIIIEGLIFR